MRSISIILVIALEISSSNLNSLYFYYITFATIMYLFKKWHYFKQIEALKI